MPEGIRVVVGLGNPGLGYARTRHNIGFRVLDRLERELGAGRPRDTGEYRVAWAAVGTERVALFRPMLFMNRSGLALSRFPESRAAGPDRHLVIQDDVWLPFGAVRFRKAVMNVQTGNTYGLPEGVLDVEIHDARDHFPGIVSPHVRGDNGSRGSRRSFNRRHFIGRRHVLPEKNRFHRVRRKRTRTQHQAC